MSQPSELLPGTVALVGAGPGDPELLTLRALRLLQQADVVLYDKLVGREILAMAPKDAEMISVGKAAGPHSWSQDAICALLVEKAKAGLRVVRLKGGDPFVFGRGGEEMDVLQRHGIAVQVVAGITAALGAAASLGLPLTHRDHAQSCVFATGHMKDHSIDLNWTALAQPRQTVVIYMGVTGLDIISRELQKAGLSGQTPAALVHRATCPEQKLYRTTLAALAPTAAEQQVQAPSLLIIGDVVQLAADTPAQA